MLRGSVSPRPVLQHLLTPSHDWHVALLHAARRDILWPSHRHVVGGLHLCRVALSQTHPAGPQRTGSGRALPNSHRAAADLSLLCDNPAAHRTAGSLLGTDRHRRPGAAGPLSPSCRARIRATPFPDPLFGAVSSASQLKLIWNLCGTPTLENWKEHYRPVVPSALRCPTQHPIALPANSALRCMSPQVALLAHVQACPE